MARRLVVLASLLSACDPAGSSRSAATAPEPAPLAVAAPAATLQALPPAPSTAPEPPKPPVVDPPPVEHVVATSGRRARGGGRGAGRTYRPNRNGQCPGAFFVESCVTGGMPFRDADGVLRARRSCRTLCSSRPPAGRCGHTGPRAYRCESYAP